MINRSVNERQTELEAWHSYILSQLEAAERLPPAGGFPPGPAVTISYQTGAGAHEIAERVAKTLQQAEPGMGVPWTVFDRKLVETVLEEHGLPKTLEKFMPEDRRTFTQDVLDELVGLRPPSWVMVPQIAETILRLADAGHVILVGRGANFITARMRNVFHVRLVASLPKRIERVRKLNGLALKDAIKLVKDEDRGRSRYTKEHFHKPVDDDLAYHLTLNTEWMRWSDAARLIAEGARLCFAAANPGAPEIEHVGTEDMPATKGN